jgi:hypothetical protein
VKTRWPDSQTALRKPGVENGARRRRVYEDLGARISILAGRRPPRPDTLKQTDQPPNLDKTPCRRGGPYVFNSVRRNRSKGAARKPPNGSSPATCATRLATLPIVAAWIDDRDIPERSDAGVAGVAFGIFGSPTVGASRFSPSLPLRLVQAAKRSHTLVFCELEELFLPLAKPLANANAAFLSPSLAAMITHGPQRLARMQGGDS